MKKYLHNEIVEAELLSHCFDYVTKDGEYIEGFEGYKVRHQDGAVEYIEKDKFETSYKEVIKNE